MSSRRMEQESPAHRARKKDPQRGAATVELGLVMALVMMLVVGIIDMGRAIHAYSSLTHAAGRAARWAAVRSSLSDAPASISMIEAKALSDAVGLDPDKVEVVTDWAPANAPGGVVSVSLSYDYQPLTPLVPSDLIRLTGASQITISN
jgi:Flp pilus assembly protein TadG